jgi:hypothetical protein
MRLLLLDTHLLVWAMGSPEWLPAALGTARWPAADHRPDAPTLSAPSGERPVLEQEGDQASELSGVLRGGVELVLELRKSASSLESSSSSCLIFCS